MRTRTGIKGAVIKVYIEEHDLFNAFTFGTIRDVIESSEFDDKGRSLTRYVVDPIEDLDECPDFTKIRRFIPKTHVIFSKEPTIKVRVVPGKQEDYENHLKAMTDEQRKKLENKNRQTAEV